uniref:Receptor ligand binding region domain-containing protein n=1 Tax=Vespula pensylvanica TaxID=30213 RepID=A0A834PGP7_VESPE|nr:hypothetical protein H0235_001257 [Vespula pensylvanica]
MSTPGVAAINNDPNILPNVRLKMRWSDTRGETVEATKAMIDMICEGVAAFFGPEGSCYVEAIVAQSRNIPMISYDDVRARSSIEKSNVVSLPVIEPIGRPRSSEPLYAFRESRGDFVGGKGPP